MGYDTGAAETLVFVELNWQIGEKHYTLFQNDGTLTPEESVAMAAEIIAAG